MNHMNLSKCANYFTFLDCYKRARSERVSRKRKGPEDKNIKFTTDVLPLCTQMQ